MVIANAIHQSVAETILSKAKSVFKHSVPSRFALSVTYWFFCWILRGRGPRFLCPVVSLKAYLPVCVLPSILFYIIGPLREARKFIYFRRINHRIN